MNEELARAEEFVGTTLKGKWRIERLLGVGGTASVFLAVHRNQKRVAVKLLHPELSGYAEVRERFLREGYVANTLETDGVVQVLDDDVTEDGQAFLVMELLDGETLERRWERANEKMDPVDVLRWMEPTLEVLQIAHGKGIVHRDIKPENLFITRDEKLKVLDFGIARIFQSAESRTRQGFVMGTPAFMAPEQALGQWDQVDARTDIWAVGATMFTLLTGRYVHQGRTGNEQLVKSAQEQAPKIATVDPYLPRQLTELVDRALAFKRDVRFPTAEAFRQAVVSVRSSLEGSDVPPARPAAAAAVAPVPEPEEDRLSAVVAKGGSASLEERLTIANAQRDKLTREMDSVTRAIAEAELKIVQFREAKRKLEDEVRSLRAEEATRSTSVRPGQSERERKELFKSGRAELEREPEHPRWREVERLAELREIADREVKSVELAKRGFDVPTFRLGVFLMAACAVLAVGLVSFLVTKPGPAVEVVD